MMSIPFKQYFGVAKPFKPLPIEQLDLGIELLSDLTWNKRKERVAAKANKTLGFVRRITTYSEVSYKHSGMPKYGITGESASPGTRIHRKWPKNG